MSPFSIKILINCLLITIHFLQKFSKKQSNLNKLVKMNNKCVQIIACAGSGKTTSLLKSAYQHAKESKFKQSVLILTYSRNSKNDFSKRLFQFGFDKFISAEQILTIHSISQTINNKIENSQQTDQFIEFCILKATNYILSRPEECRQTAKLKKVKHLFIDEAQDLSEIQFNFVHSLVGLLGCDVFFVGDPCQCIYQFQGAKTHLMYKIPYLFNQSQIEERTLNINYRSQQKIVELADAIRPDKSICGNTDLPQVTPKLILQSKDCYLEAIVRQIQQSAKIINGQLNYDHIAVIGSVKCSKSVNLGLQQIRNKLSDVNIPMQVQYALDDEGSTNRGQSIGEGVNLLTIHSSKGLEFEVVILIDFHQALMNKQPTISEYEEIHKNLIYVAITRAKRELFMFAIFNKISPLFQNLFHHLEIIVSPDCKIKGAPITNIQQLFDINQPKFIPEHDQDANTVTDLVKQLTVNQNAKNIELQSNIMSSISGAIIDFQKPESSELCQQLYDYSAPLGVVAEHIANFSIFGEQYLEKLRQDFSDQVYIVIDYNFKRHYISLKSPEEFQIQIQQQTIALKHQDIAKIQHLLNSGKTIKLTRKSCSYLSQAVEGLQKVEKNNIQEVYKIFYEMAIADFVEEKNAEHIYSENYLQHFQNELNNLQMIPQRLQLLKFNDPLIQFPIHSPNLRLLGIIDLMTQDFIVEFKYKNNLSISDYLQVLLYGLIYDPSNQKKRVLVNLKNGEIKIIDLSGLPNINRNILFSILDMSNRRMHNSVLIYDFETTVDENQEFPNPNYLNITDRYIYDYDHKIAVSDGLVNQQINGQPIINSKKAIEITGITNEMLDQSGESLQIFQGDLRIIQKYYENPMFVAHYPYNGFDNILIQRYFRTCVASYSYRVVNSLRLFKCLQKEKQITADLSNFKLQTLYSNLVDSSYVQEHRAKSDVGMIVGLFDNVLQTGLSTYLSTNSKQQFI